MEVIDHIEVGAGGASSITFMNVGDIPSDYTDLLLVSSLRTNFVSGDVNDSALLTINGSTANQSQRTLFGDGSSATSFTATRIRAGDGGSTAVTANTFGNASCYISNYRSSSAKSFSIDSVFENNATGASQFLHAGLWTGTDPITSLTLTPRQGTAFAQYSSFTLYGIRKYNTTLAPKASGGIISYDSVNNKWVHVFTASGTFTPTQNLSGVEYLVVAGGGGGGFQGAGGGGGAGGYRSSVVGESSGGGASAESTLSLTASTGYTVTVGAGGAGSGSTSVKGTSGSSSVFSTITSTGGGGGGSDANTGGLSGGSGGGAALGGSSFGTGTANQGFNGGRSFGTGPTGFSGGGGGGAGSVGTDGLTAVGGNGGAGVTSSITGTAVGRAGGGASGGAATNGTATDGGGQGFGTAGAVNTGGGGAPNGAGGSGIVIVRYSA